MRFKIRPIGLWTDPETPDRRSSGVFRATWDSTLDLLGREAESLGAGLVVVQVDVREVDLRLDGTLKARASVSHPGVAVSFESEYGPLRYATDQYEQQWRGAMPGWQANVRAIALALGALRAVDRYGVTRRGEQYRGWTAIPSAPPGRGPFTGRDDAEAWMILCATECGIGTWDDWEALYKALAKRMHPDTATGNPDLWERLDAAATLLGARGGPRA